MRGSVAPLRAAWSLARRDLLEFLRDRRTVVVTLLLPMVTYPLVALSSALGVRTALESTIEQQVATPLSLVLSGAEAQLLAARLGQLLHAAGDDPPPEWPSDVFAEIEPPPRAEELLEGGKVDLWIDVPAGFTQGLAQFGTVSIAARVSDSYPADQKTRDQFEALIASLAAQVRQERMEAAGVPLSLFKPIELSFAGKPVAKQAVADRSVVAPVAGAILVLLAVLTMTGAFYPAIDAIAGEKERGTIETLLIVPCGAGDIVFGKFLAVFGVTLATLAANVISILLTILVSLRFLPGASVGYYFQNIGGGTLITLLAFVGLAAVAAAMSLAVTTASKSVKEAQNTLTPVILLVSALAGVAIVPGIRSDGFVPAVPFAGQVVVSRTALTPPAEQPATIAIAAVGNADRPQLQPPDTGPTAALLPLLVTLCSSGLVTLVLLRGTAAMLTDEEILFRGPDAAGGFRRPPRRAVPGVIHGGLALALGLAGLWYAQGLSPPDIVLAIPIQQLAVVLPLAVLLFWQRIGLRRTFALRWPGAGRGFLRLTSGVTALAGGLLIGGGLFVLGAAALLRFGGIELSPAMRELSEKLLGLMLEQPWWLAWCLMAVLPACLEELLFRGWVLAAFTGDQPSRRRKIIAVVAQAACFAIFHLLPERMPQTFVLGLALGTIVLATGSLYPAILCHIANNSMPLLLLYGSGSAIDVAASQQLAHEIGGLSVPPLAVALAAAGVLLGGLFIAWSGWLRQRGRLSGLVAGGLLVTLLTTPLAGHAADDTPAAAASGIATPLRVAIMPIRGLVEFVGDSPQGYSIDLWSELADRIGGETTFVQMASIEELFEATQTGKVDVLLGPLAMTEQRERLVDFTHPVADSGLRIAVLRESDSGLLEALATLLSWELLTILAGVIGTMVLTGHLLWWFERRHNAESFPARYPRGVWEAVWWSTSTIITGGCENKEIATVTGRVIAVAWMIGGIVLVALLTSTLTATMTVERVTGTIRSPRDLAGKLVACQEGAVAVAAVREYGGSVETYENLDAMLRALADEACDAVVTEDHTLMLAIQELGSSRFRLVGGIFDSFDFGLALPPGSPLREPLNTAILQLREAGLLDEIKDRWFGEHD